MGKDIYKLQIPISTELAEQLKYLANQDERSLRSYCRRLIQQHIDDSKDILINMDRCVLENNDSTIVSDENNAVDLAKPENKNDVNETKVVEKKIKVGALTKPTK